MCAIAFGRRRFSYAKLDMALVMKSIYMMSLAWL